MGNGVGVMKEECARIHFVEVERVSHTEMSVILGRKGMIIMMSLSLVLPPKLAVS